jgi:GT2 family glycosyltransferase
MDMHNASLALGASGSMAPAYLQLLQHRMCPSVIMCLRLELQGGRSTTCNAALASSHCHGLKKFSREYSLVCIHRDHYRQFATLTPLANHLLLTEARCSWKHSLNSLSAKHCLDCYLLIYSVILAQDAGRV